MNGVRVWGGGREGVTLLGEDVSKGVQLISLQIRMVSDLKYLFSECQENNLLELYRMKVLKIG